MHPASICTAFEFFLNADEVGHWKAAFTVGSMYDTGVGVTQNATKALHYFRKVFKDRARCETCLQPQATMPSPAWLGSASCMLLALRLQLTLGMPLQHCSCIHRSAAKCAANLSCLRLACPSCRGLARSWSSLVNAAADAHEDEDLFGTISRLALAAEQGSDAATLNAAWMAHRGLGRAGRKALDFAARLYERAAKQGSSAGAVELAHLILNAEHLGMSRPCNVSEVRPGRGGAVSCVQDER